MGQMMEATTNQELNKIRDENLDFLHENPELYSSLRQARKRINRIRKESKRNWKLQMN